jgi:hypothetical protein
VTWLTWLFFDLLPHGREVSARQILAIFLVAKVTLVQVSLRVLVLFSLCIFLLMLRIHLPVTNPI